MGAGDASTLVHIRLVVSGRKRAGQKQNQYQRELFHEAKTQMRRGSGRSGRGGYQRVTKRYTWIWSIAYRVGRGGKRHDICSRDLNSGQPACLPLRLHLCRVRSASRRARGGEGAGLQYLTQLLPHSAIDMRVSHAISDPRRRECNATAVGELFHLITLSLCPITDKTRPLAETRKWLFEYGPTLLLCPMPSITHLVMQMLR